MTKTVEFWKMSGAGNDFVVVDNRRGSIRGRAQFARRVCRRSEGIGADGLLLLESSRAFDFRMRYFNADGSDGGMCGNGGRCLSWFAYTLRIAGRSHVFEALGKEYSARIVGPERVRLSFPDPTGYRAAVRTGSSGFRHVSFIDTGAPHAVAIVDRDILENLDVREEGRQLRLDAAFKPSGANINFMSRQGISVVRMRTYERGVEDETLACGTGSIACALVAARRWDMVSPINVKTRGGEVLVVKFESQAGRVQKVSLEGSARVTFRGTIRV